MSLKKNTIANYLGQGWAAIMSLAFIPLYIKYLGIEAYGLIGVFAVLQAWLSLPDMGMTPTLTREMARFTAGAHTPQSIRNLLRSLELICVGMAILVGLLIWSASDWLATDWLKAGKLPVQSVAQAITLMGIVAALRFVEGLYRGAIVGLQKQVWLNSVHAVLSTVRAAGAVGILAWVSPTIEAYFIWQSMMSIAYLTILAVTTHRTLPKPAKPAQFSLTSLSEIWRFASGMMVITVLALLLMQVDKILLSRLISLESFGYYTLAGTVASSIYLLVAPITQAFYPRFTELVAKDDLSGLIQVYHRSAQLVTVLAAPVALMLIFFGEKLLALWTGNTNLAHDVAPLLGLLAAGTLLNGLMHIPYMLQLAYGWTRFAVKTNIVAVSILVPAILWVTPRYGATGAAWIWVTLNLGYVLIGVHYMYRRLLPGEKWKWYVQDITIPMLAAGVVITLSWYTMPNAWSKYTEISWLLITGVLSSISAIMSSKPLRANVAKYIIINKPYKP